MTTPNATARNAQVAALKAQIEALKRQAAGLRAKPLTAIEQWEADLTADRMSKTQMEAELYRLRLWSSQVKELEAEKDNLTAEINRLSAT